MCSEPLRTKRIYKSEPNSDLARFGYGDQVFEEIILTGILFGKGLYPKTR
jgi:hypothetical protein